jgi:hypothetical protein
MSSRILTHAEYAVIAPLLAGFEAVATSLRDAHWRRAVEGAGVTAVTVLVLLVGVSATRWVCRKLDR